MTLSVEKWKFTKKYRQAEGRLFLLHTYPDITEPESSLNYKEAFESSCADLRI